MRFRILPVLALAALLAAGAVPASPAWAASVTTNKAPAANLSKDGTTTPTSDGGTVALMSEKECKRAGGRIATNSSCFSGKQCRGIMHQDCISASK